MNSGQENEMQTSRDFAAFGVTDAKPVSPLRTARGRISERAAAARSNGDKVAAVFPADLEEMGRDIARLESIIRKMAPALEDAELIEREPDLVCTVSLHLSADEAIAFKKLAAEGLYAEKKLHEPTGENSTHECWGASDGRPCDKACVLNWCQRQGA